MNLSTREWGLALATGAVVLYTAGFMLLVKPRLEELRTLRQRQADTRWQIERDTALAGERARWEGELDAMLAKLPRQPADKRMDVHWLAVMDQLAARHGIAISRRQAGEEQKQGDIYELPLECREWEGSLEALVRFLFALREEGGMFDMRQLLVRPKAKNLLRGRFTLYCAYMREATGAGAAGPTVERSKPNP